MNKRLLPGALAALLLISNGFWPIALGQNEGDFFERVQKAKQAKDYKQYAALLQGALDRGIVAPGILYRLAGAHALLGNKAESVKFLGRVADVGVSYPAAANPDFDSIKDSDDFKAVLAAFERNVRPFGKGAKVAVLPEKDLIPEGVAYDPVEKTIYVSSIYRRKIVAVDSKGKVRDFISSGQDGFLGGLGMKVDVRRRVLWACSYADAQSGAADGVSGLFKFDLRTGKLLKKYMLDPASAKVGFNDLDLNAEGDVFTTATDGAAVYRVRHDADTLELFLKSDELFYPNGIALTPDGSKLFVAHFGGILVIDVRTKAVSKLAHPENVTVCGIDGLYFHRNSLIAVQNSFDPNRVVRFFLNSKLDRVERVQVLDSANPLFQIPTTGAVGDGWFYYLANSQLDSLGPDGTLAPPEKLREIVVLRTKL